MNLDDFEKAKKELKQEKHENKKKIGLYDRRRRILRENSFGYKAGATLTFSMFVYLAIFFITTLLINNLGLAAITNIFPGLSFPIMTIGASLGIGELTRILIYKKLHVKNKLRSFSSAKSQAEKFEEETQYQIEMEKAQNKDLVLKRALNVLNANEAMTREISGSDNQNNIYGLKDEAEAKRVTEKLSAFIGNQYARLDMLTTQKVLFDKFWMVRSTTQSGVDVLYRCLMNGILAMYFSLFPLAMVKASIPFSTLPSCLMTIFTPFIVSAIGTFGYMVKRNSDYKKAFNNINSQLGVNALPKRYVSRKKADEKRQSIKMLLEKQISDISLAVIQLKEEQHVLDSISSSDSSEALAKSKYDSRDYEDYMDQTYSHAQATSKMPYTEEDVNEYVQECMKASSVDKKENSPKLKKSINF